MIKKTYVTHFQRDHGPGKLAAVLKKGLQQLGVELVSFDNAEHISCLQWMDDKLTVNDFSGKKALLGPNIWETPSERPYVAERFSDFIVPSAWVKTKCLSDSIMHEKNVHIWSGGIETDIWLPRNIEKDIDCFIYFKNRDLEEFRTLYNIAAELKLTGVVIEYGNYNEEQLFEICQRSKFAMLLTNTESQGYAYMQMLSCGVPCLVFNKDLWSSRDGSTSFAATSVPYFDQRCGTIVNDINKQHVEEFISRIDRFSPREYILENHTVDISTRRYLELLENVSS